jgi:hypothetical protein
LDILHSKGFQQVEPYLATSATQVVKSPQDPIISDLDSGTVDDALHRFSESLKVFYKEGRVFGEVEDFYGE